MKKQFETPRVLQEVRLDLETNFLASIVDESMVVESSGQAVTDIDATSDEFKWNEKWEWE